MSLFERFEKLFRRALVISKKKTALVASFSLLVPAAALAQTAIPFQGPEQSQLARHLKDGYLVLSAEIDLKQLSNNNKIAGSAPTIDLDCKSGRTFSSSHMSYALGLGISLLSSARSPAAATTVDLLSGALTPEPMVPLAYVIDLDDARCDWNYHTSIALGAARISDIGHTIRAQIKRLASQSEDPKFIELFVKAAQSLVPFGSTASIAKKLLLDPAEQQAAQNLQQVFANLSRSGIISRYPLTWRWRNSLGQERLAFYSRKFSRLNPTPHDRKAFVVKLIAEPTVSLFDADYEINGNTVVRKYNFGSSPLSQRLGGTSAKPHSVESFLSEDGISSLWKVINNAAITPGIFSEPCGRIKDAIQERFGLIDDDAAFVMHALLQRTSWRSDPKLRSAGCPDGQLIQSINRLLVQSGRSTTAIAVPNAEKEHQPEVGDLIDRFAAAGRNRTERARLPAYDEILDERVSFADGDKVFTDAGSAADKPNTVQALAKQQIRRMACNLPGEHFSEATTFGILEGQTPKRFEANLKVIVIPDDRPRANLYKIAIKELKSDDRTKSRLRSLKEEASSACKRFFEEELNDLL